MSLLPIHENTKLKCTNFNDIRTISCKKFVISKNAFTFIKINVRLFFPIRNKKPASSIILIIYMEINLLCGGK